MKKLVLTLATAAVFFLAGCGAVGNAGQGNPGSGTTAAGTSTVNMSAVNFVPNNSNVTVKAGQAVKFVDPLDTGGLHYLVTGTNGTLSRVPGAPAELSTATGLPINAGDTKSITFSSAGTYMITCTIHPYMEVTIVVTP